MKLIKCLLYMQLKLLLGKLKFLSLLSVKFGWNWPIFSREQVKYISIKFKMAGKTDGQKMDKGWSER